MNIKDSIRGIEGEKEDEAVAAKLFLWAVQTTTQKLWWRATLQALRFPQAGISMPQSRSYWSSRKTQTTKAAKSITNTDSSSTQKCTTFPPAWGTCFIRRHSTCVLAFDLNQRWAFLLQRNYSLRCRWPHETLCIYSTPFAWRTRSFDEFWRLLEAAPLPMSYNIRLILSYAQL